MTAALSSHLFTGELKPKNDPRSVRPSDAVGGRGTPDQLQMVYIVPAADGSRILTAHYAFEAAEGFGRRFAYLANTLTVIDSRAVGG